jgi:ADP-ribose pyrophosphatase YjhB (NUDIX family)
MYNIFIKNSVIIIGEQASENETYSSIIPAHSYPVPDHLNDLHSGNKKVFLQTDQPDLYFKVFKKQFKVIEAGGGAVFREDGKLLMIKRLGVWDLPKGKLEKSESAKDGAIREVEEECHISGLSITQKLAPTYHLYQRNGWNLKKTHWYRMDCMDYKNAKPQLEEDIVAIEWFSLNEVFISSLNTYPSIKEVLLQL